jgi:hypothetical protein
MAGETDAERLIVLLEARIRDFEKNMLKAAGTADGSYQRMRRGSRTATEAMERDMVNATSRINQALAQASLKIGSYGKAFAVGIVGGLTAGGVEGIVTRVRGLVREVAQLGDEAARAGLSVRAFQQWKAVAETTRVPIDALTDAFKELNIRADEFVSTGKGSAADAFKRLGMSQQDIRTRLKQPSELMQELIARTQRLKDVAAGTRIFDELFGGTGGERMVKFLQMADGEIEGIIRSAEEAGAIFDEEMIRKADEMDRRWSTAWRNFEIAAKVGIFNTVSYLDQLRDKMAEIGNADVFQWLVGKLDAAGMIDPSLARAGETQEFASGRANLIGLERRAKILEDAIENQRKLGFDAIEATQELAKARAEMEQEIARILANAGRGTIGETGGVTNLPTITIEEEQSIDQAAEFIKRFREELKLTADQRREMAETERILADAQREGVELTRLQANELARETIERDEAEKAARRSVETRQRSADATKLETEEERRFNAVIELQKDLLFERAQLMRDPVEQRVHAELRSVGVDINTQLGQRLATDIRINEEIARQMDGYEQVKDLLGTIGQVAAGIFKGAKESVWDWVDAVVEPIFDLPPEKIAAMVAAAFVQEKAA